MELELPHEWAAREYQKPLMRYMFEGGIERKRAACVWHRRAGKDSCCLQIAAIASQLKVGTIWHMLPTLKQGRKVVWEYIDKQGRRSIDQAFPKEMRIAGSRGSNDADMLIRFRNGSNYQVVGSDNYDSLVGSNVMLVIFSEFSVADPTAWDYIRPILAENDGSALFIYTFRGRNHGWRLHEMATKNPKWFSSVLTVDDTVREDGVTPVIGPDVIQEERDSGMSEEKVLQEYYCSPDAGLEGAFYTREMLKAEKEGRIGYFPHDPQKLCQAWWDIGYKDATVVIITQRNDAGYPDIIDCFAERNQSVAWWNNKIRNSGYTFEEPHWGPHDLEQHEWGSGKTKKELAAELGLYFDIVPNVAVEDGIEATRAIINVARFNEKTTVRLRDALLNYRREKDEKAQRYKDKPLHDWASDYADAVRYMSVGWHSTGDKYSPRLSASHRVIRAIGGAPKTLSKQEQYPWLFDQYGRPL